MPEIMNNQDYQPMTFDAIKIGLANPETIMSPWPKGWSHGEVTKPETINYRTLKPEPNGLFCEAIFGPSKDWECHCGHYKKIRYKGTVCEKCHVEVTKSSVRRERMGHIELEAPVSHIWYFKGIPSRIGQMLDLSPRILEKVLYFASYIVLDAGSTDLQKGTVLSEREYMEQYEKWGIQRQDEYFAAHQDLVRLKDANGERRAKEAELDAAAGEEDESAAQIRTALQSLNDEIAAIEQRIEERKHQHLGFYAAMGAEAVRYLLEEIDLDKEAETMKAELEEVNGQKKSNGQKKARIIKRLEVVESFRESGNKPEWMILTAIPVIPPDLRPMVQLDGGRFATSDLNDLYRRIINRNNRLKRLNQLNAPEIIIRNEKRMLQEAVDALIDNGRRGRPVTGPGNRPLKSLSDMLKGKSGRFRQNLLGKRVDYSGRSVIVVGPELKIYQCGLPKEMAIELFKPFVMKELASRGISHNIKSAKKMVERLEPQVWDVLEDVIAEHPVMLNRAPTLHRLGIQAFEPILVEGKAIKLHPLVCTAFNADFDGDQMAVHLPLSVEAQAECRFMLLSPNNLLKPSDGGPVAVPSQDMVLGIYYLTQERPGSIGEGMVFKSMNEAILAYENKEILLQTLIKVRRTVTRPDGTESSGIITTTLGRLFFNEILPQDLGFVDRTAPENELVPEVDFLVGKKQLKQILQRVIDNHGATTTAEVLDHIKSMGYKYSTRAAMTVSISDMTVPPQKPAMIAKAQDNVDYIGQKCKEGFLTEEERYKQVVRNWESTDNRLKDALMDGLDKYNNIFMMADSGARGSQQQIKQLAGMRGLMADTTGHTIELPIKSNFREGLDVLEYFMSAHGARKGLSDTALRTADSGYLTRRMVDVSQELIIRETDCSENRAEIPGIYISEIRDETGVRIIETLEERLRGRYSCEDVVTPDGEVIVKKNHMITSKRAARIVNEVKDENGEPVKKIKIRSILTCKCQIGICSKCYGSNMASGEPVQIGETVGIIAAQSIGEPGTQLTMRTFHTGGVAGGDITQGLPRVEELFEARKPKGLAIISDISGIAEVHNDKKREVIVTNEETGESKAYTINYGSRIVDGLDGKYVEAGDKLTVGSVNPHDILRVKGADAVRDYMICEVQKPYRDQGVDISDKHIEVLVRQMLKKVRVEESGDTGLLPGTMIDGLELEAINERLEAEGKQTATSKQVLLGITKASLATNSWMSAASFQETTKVLTDAAIKGKVDRLIGLKENVIIGKLIPAGTGMRRYRNVQIESDDDLFLEEDDEMLDDILLDEEDLSTPLLDNIASAAEGADSAETDDSLDDEALILASELEDE